MKILITGVAGFIGYHLATELLKKNVTVIGIDSINSYYDPKLKLNRLNQLIDYEKFTFFAVNITNKVEIDELFFKNKIDIVINLAAQAGVRYSIEKPYKYVDSNLIGFINLLEACRNYKVDKLVFASSSSVYGDSKNIPFSVNQETSMPKSLYAATKKANELMAYTYSELYGIKAIGLRFFTVYGPWGRPDMAYFSFTEKILKGEPISVFNNGNMKRDFTFIDDIISGITNLLEQINRIKGNYKIYNLGNNKPVKLTKFISVIETCLNKKAVIKLLPMQAGDVEITYADIDDAKKDFNYNPKTNIDTGLQHFVNWYKKYYNK
jgi:UDP-glucuronate 4-epimerase